MTNDPKSLSNHDKRSLPRAQEALFTDPLPLRTKAAFQRRETNKIIEGYGDSTSNITLSRLCTRFEIGPTEDSFPLTPQFHSQPPYPPTQMQHCGERTEALMDPARKTRGSTFLTNPYVQPTNCFFRNESLTSQCPLVNGGSIHHGPRR